MATRDILAIRELYLQIAGLHVGDNDVDRGGNRMHLVVLRTCNVLGWKAKEASWKLHESEPRDWIMRRN